VIFSDATLSNEEYLIYVCCILKNMYVYVISYVEFESSVEFTFNTRARIEFWD